MPNEYSDIWFNTFLRDKNAAETESEVAFLVRQLPVSQYRSILDLCCGYGRHINALAQNGYQVTGVDRDTDALETAKKSAAANAEFVQLDMRDISGLSRSFDAVICMWQSFGYFGDADNDNILMRISGILPPRGRFILDIFNRSYFENHLGTREFEKREVTITEKTEKQGDRFHMTLRYSDHPDIVDEFNWRLYGKDEIISLCERYDLLCETACTWCTENEPVTAAAPRMQLVFEKDQHAKPY